MRWLILTLSLTCGAQSAGDLFSKAPPDVDAALRARVTEFYSLQQNGKYRASEKMVCEDSKDAYYDSMKSSIKSFEFIKIEYTDSFQKATVVGRFEGDFRTPQGTMKTVYPMTSVWRVEGGAWCMYIPPPPKEIQTPFGIARPGDAQTPAGGVPLPPIPTMGPGGTPNMEALGRQIREMVRLSRTEMKVQSGEKSSDEIDIVNNSRTPVQVSVVAPERKGLKVILSDATVGAGRQATIRLEYDPPDKTAKLPYDFTVKLLPFNRSFQVHVIFDIPESIKKLLPPGTIKDE